MKKLIITICLLFLLRISSAPGTLMPYITIIQNNEVIYDPNIQKYEKEFIRFANHLGRIESNNDWTQINAYNMIGEWQFSPVTLEHLGYGYVTPKEFKKNSSIFPREQQIEALKLLININKSLLVPYSQYVGSTINGVPITISGLLAGMHLGGIGSVKLYIESNGYIDKSDANGVKISDYIKEFRSYNLAIK